MNLVHVARVGAAAGSAVLGVLAFHPFNQAWAAWVALIPIMLAVRHAGDGWRTGWLSGTLFSAGTLWWIGYVTPVGAALVCVYLGLYWGAWAFFWQRVCVAFPQTRSRDNLAAAILGALGWVGLDAVRGVLLGGFPWNKLAVSQYQNIAMIQVASIGGADMLTFLIVFVNGVAALTLVRFAREMQRQQKLRPHLDFSFCVGLVGVVFLWGVYQVGQKQGDTVPLRVAVVQGNIPQDVKFDAMQADGVVSCYKESTLLVAAYKPDVVIWPETAPGSVLFQDLMMQAALNELKREVEAPLLVGAIEYAGGCYYNAAFWVDKGIFLDGQWGQKSVYRKQHLLPFGEYLPFRKWMPWLAALVPLPSDYTAGQCMGVFPILADGGKVMAGGLICFEDVLPELSRQHAKAGAQLLVNLTNDAWFKSSPAAWQHASNAIFRSVETGLPLIRCSNTGVSCLVDGKGRVTDVLTDEEGKSVEVGGFLTGQIQVPVSPAETFYSRFGHYFPVLCFVGACFFGAWILSLRSK